MLARGLRVTVHHTGEMQWQECEVTQMTLPPQKWGERSLRTQLSSFLCFHLVQDSSLGDGTAHIPHRTFLSGNISGINPREF